MLKNENLTLEYNTDSLLVNWDVLNNRIQSELAANLWGKDYRYYIRLNADKQFQTALENFDIAIKETLTFSMLSGLREMYEALVGIKKPQVLLTCEICLIDIN